MWMRSGWSKVVCSPSAITDSRWISTVTDKRNLKRFQTIKNITKGQQTKGRTRSDARRNKDGKPFRHSRSQFTGVQDASSAVTLPQIKIPDEPKNSKSLDIAVIGRPNAGKSSLLNRVLDFKLSAVSAKYNTTRDQVLGVRTRGETQMSFYDTPGAVNPQERHRFVQTLVSSAQEAVSSVDVSMLVVDAVKKLDEESIAALEDIIRSSAEASSPILLVLNKVDLARSRAEAEAHADQLQELIRRVWAEVHSKRIKATEDSDADIKDFELEWDPNDNTEPIAKDVECEDFEVDDEDEEPTWMAEGIQQIESEDGCIGERCYMVSALRGYGINDLSKALESLAVPRPWAHHSSVKSNKSDLEMVEEIIREKLYRRFNKELPYSLQQVNRGWTPFRDGSLRIDQDILVPATRLKRMVIGHRGDAIRSVGIDARKDIEALFEKKVHLYLNVKEQKLRPE